MEALLGRLTEMRKETDGRKYFGNWVTSMLPQIHNTVWPSYVNCSYNAVMWAVQESEKLREQGGQQRPVPHYQQPTFTAPMMPTPTPTPAYLPTPAFQSQTFQSQTFSQQPQQQQYQTQAPHFLSPPPVSQAQQQVSVTSGVWNTPSPSHGQPAAQPVSGSRTLTTPVPGPSGRDSPTVDLTAMSPFTSLLAPVAQVQSVGNFSIPSIPSLSGVLSPDKPPECGQSDATD